MQASPTDAQAFNMGLSPERERANRGPPEEKISIGAFLDYLLQHPEMFQGGKKITYDQFVYLMLNFRDQESRKVEYLGGRSRRLRQKRRKTRYNR